MPAPGNRGTEVRVTLSYDVSAGPWPSTSARSPTNSSTTTCAASNRSSKPARSCAPTALRAASGRVRSSRSIPRGAHTLMCERCVSNQCGSVIDCTLTHSSDQVRVPVSGDRNRRVPGQFRDGADVRAAGAGSMAGEAFFDPLLAPKTRPATAAYTVARSGLHLMHTERPSSSAETTTIFGK